MPVTLATFTSSGTWTCPAGVTSVLIEAWGGGGGGGHGDIIFGAAGGGGGGFAASTVSVTPGNVYTYTVGAGGGADTSGGDSTFVGDSGATVTAKGGGHGNSGGSSPAGGAGGQASASTGNTRFNGGNGHDGGGGGFGGGGGGGGAGSQGDGSIGLGAPSSVGGAGGAGGTPDGGTGGTGSGANGTGLSGSDGLVPGGGGGGAGNSGSATSGASGQIIIRTPVARVSHDSVEALIAGTGAARISQESVETLLAGTGKALVSQEALEVLLQNTGIASAGVSQIAVEVLISNIHETDAGFIASKTKVYPIFSIFESGVTRLGPGNSSEVFSIDLAPSGTSQTATLTTSISNSSNQMLVSGDSGFTAVNQFMVTIDNEVIYVQKISAGVYKIIGRAYSNTTKADHSNGASVVWGDHYDMAIPASAAIAASFTDNILSSGITTYGGWVFCYESTQAYIGSSRYPMHVSSLLGIFPTGTGSSGTNKCDAAQPNSVCIPTGVSDNCPAALTNPSRLTSDINVGDVGVARYSNPEASVMTLGSRAADLQAWYGLYRVDSSNNDVTLANPNGTVIDGSVEASFHNPSATAISPDTGLPSPNLEPYTTVNMPGSDRAFTHGGSPSPPNFSDKAWPIGVLSVRQGTSRVPKWASYDWHNFNFVWTGFAVDATFAQVVVNRNGVVFGNTTFALPGSQDISGPNAVWDDGGYYFSVAWFVALFTTPYLVIGPSFVGGNIDVTPTPEVFVPVVSFPGGGGGGPGSPSVYTPPAVEGGGGGNINPPGATRFNAKLV